MNITLTDILLIAVLICLAALIVLVLIRTGSRREERLLDEELKLIEESENRIARWTESSIGNIRSDITARMEYDAEEARRGRTETSEMLAAGQERMERSLKNAVLDLQEQNRRKLDEMRTDISRRLDVSLNERLDASFKNVGDQLSRLYVSLNELSRLESGVSSLNKTLSNVKTRGLYGEMQLEHILSDILPQSLYDKNVVTRKSQAANRDAVEFAVRIPDKEAAGDFMYLPIDSKFPMDCFERITKASEGADAVELKEATKELEQRVKSEARDISDKYLDPPYTTDFGVMFLPAESLYAEVMRIPGLAEECQKKYRIVITGPSTCAAFLSSLSIGFRYMAVNRDSQKILKLLSAIKTQYATLGQLIENAGNRLEMARKANDELKHRTDIINKRLSSVEELDPAEARNLLGIKETLE